MAGLFNTYKTDKHLERDGVELQYPEGVLIKVARAGGTNQAYTQLLRKRTKPVQRQIDQGTLPQETSQELLAKVYAETIVLGWRTWVEDLNHAEGGVFKDAILFGDNDWREFSKENCVELFMALPDLFLDVQTSASEHAAFMAEEDAEEVKSSSELSSGSSTGDPD